MWGVFLHHSSLYSLEIGSLVDPGAKLAATTPWQPSRRHSPQLRGFRGMSLVRLFTQMPGIRKQVFNLAEEAPLPLGDLPGTLF